MSGLPTAPDLMANALRDLQSLDRVALAARWVAAFGCPAPRHCQAPLLRGALAWQMQMLASEWHKPARAAGLIRSLRRHAMTPLNPGTRLIREWQGRTHQVNVVAKGYEYDGVVYRSLTAIARQITGTAWSGPLFFGLRS